MTHEIRTEPRVGDNVLQRTIPWWEPRMTGLELERLKGVVESNFLNDGEVTREFEAAIAAHVSARHGVAVTSGTMAIFLALVGVGVRRGDEVIVPDLTFIATANAVTLAGATPVIADVDPAALTLDPNAFERAITPRTRAVVPVHVSGRAADMRAICAIAAARGIAVVEDAAEAYGSAYHGAYLGTIGMAGCLSFSPHKTITTGQGGIVLTNDDDLALRLRAMKDQGRTEPGTGGDDAHPLLGYNLKFTNLQAAVGLAQLSALDERLARQRRIYALYAAGLRDTAQLTLPGFQLEDGEVPLWTDALADDRDDLVADLAAAGMRSRRFWHPLHTHPPYRSSEPFPHSSAAAQRAFWLPSAFTLSDADVAAVVGRVIAHYRT